MLTHAIPWMNLKNIMKKPDTKSHPLYDSIYKFQTGKSREVGGGLAAARRCGGVRGDH